MALADRRTNQFIEDTDSRVSVGIQFPIGRTPNSVDGYFNTTKTTIDSIKNNINLLLQTNIGERVFQPTMGMSLRQYLFEPLTDDITAQIENNIVDMFEKWMPFLEIQEITLTKLDDLNRINIKLIFNIKRTPDTLNTVQLTLSTNDTAAGQIVGGTGDGVPFGETVDDTPL